MFLLTACSNTVVVQPLAFKDVDPALLKKPEKPVCIVPSPKPDAGGVMRLNAAELQAWGKCNAAAVDDMYARLTGLQRSVIAKQRAAHKALAAAKL